MDFRYVQYDPSLAARQELLNTLRSLFHHLLLQTSGDVDEALRWLEQIAERYGLLSADVSIDDFKKWLEEQEAIEQTPQGFQLTHRGERAIRQESLDAIFSALGKDGAGDHRVSSPGDGIERLPETRGLFDKNMGNQYGKFAATLELCVMEQKDPNALDELLSRMGRRHGERGVMHRYYPVFVDCLIEAMAAQLGEAWTAAHETAWRAALGHIADRMTAAAQAAE